MASHQKLNSEAPFDRPKVSVVIPVFNKEDLIESTLQSVFDQTFTDYEIVVVDDGSTDTSSDLLKGYGDRIRYRRQKNAGPSVARNTGVKLAKGEYVAFLDADDRWNQDKLEKQLTFFAQHPDLAWGACNYINCDDTSNTRELECKGLVGDWTVFENWFDANKGKYMILTSGVIIRREIFDQVGLFDTSIPAGQDIDLWIRIARVEPRYAYCNLSLFDYLNITNSVSKPSWKKFDSNTRFVEKHIPIAIETNDPSYCEFIRVETEKLIKKTLSNGMPDLTKRLIGASPASWKSSTSGLMYRMLAMLPSSLLKLITKTYRSTNILKKTN